MTPRFLLAALPLPFAILAFAACGSEVSTATGGSGGSGGTSSGSGGAAACPDAEPGFGAPCSVEGQSCSYGPGCCPNVYLCDGSKWQALATGCAEPPVMCPVDPPLAGSTCDDCQSPGPCSYGCPGTMATLQATCTAGTWAYSGECPVPPPANCDGTICPQGQICLETGGGAGFSFSCVDDPCFPAPLSCACATSLCSGAMNTCSVMGQQLSCDCTTCP